MYVNSAHGRSFTARDTLFAGPIHDISFPKAAIPEHDQQNGLVMVEARYWMILICCSLIDFNICTLFSTSQILLTLLNVHKFLYILKSWERLQTHHG